MYLATPPALQDVWPSGTCYGCGPANAHGLHIKSYWSEDKTEVVCTFHPEPKFNAGFDNVMYGGLVASLCDCHSVWTAIASLYRYEQREHGSQPSISCVTARLEVNYLVPTPLDKPVVLRARPAEISSTGRRASIYCAVYSGDLKTAEAHVVAVRVSADKSTGAQTHGA